MWLVEVVKADALTGLIVVCAMYYSFKWILQIIHTALGGGKLGND